MAFRPSFLVIIVVTSIYAASNSYRHQYNNAPWLGGAILSRTKKGAANISSKSLPQLPKRLPVTVAHMKALRRKLNLKNPRDAAVWAAACAAWHGCNRLGEIVLKARWCFNPRKHMSRGTSKKSGRASNGRRWLQLFLPWSKVKKFEGEWLHFTASNDDIDCILAIDNHLTINAAIPDHAPFFAYLDSSVPDGYSPLTRSDLMERCNEIWVSAGLTALSGHSFRIGGTTHLLIHGVDPWIVMKQGRWSSKAFLLYWRNVEEILSLFIGDSMDKFSSIKTSIQHIQKL